MMGNISSWSRPARSSFCFNHYRYKTCVTRKQTLRSLSLSYQKDGRAWPRPSSFWYDTDFSEFDSADIIDYILKKSVSYQKKGGRDHGRPSFFWYDNDKDLKVCFLVTHVIGVWCRLMVRHSSFCNTVAEALKYVLRTLNQGLCCTDKYSSNYCFFLYRIMNTT